MENITVLFYIVCTGVLFVWAMKYLPDAIFYLFTKKVERAPDVSWKPDNYWWDYRKHVELENHPFEPEWEIKDGIHVYYSKKDTEHVHINNINSRPLDTDGYGWEHQQVALMFTLEEFDGYIKELQKLKEFIQSQKENSNVTKTNQENQ